MPTTAWCGGALSRDTRLVAQAFRSGADPNCVDRDHGTPPQSLPPRLDRSTAPRAGDAELLLPVAGMVPRRSLVAMFVVAGEACHQLLRVAVVDVNQEPSGRRAAKHTGSTAVV
jgi:hypothetical protein